MKYFLLAEWVKENSNTDLIINKVLITPGTLLISFNNNQNLIFHYKTSAPMLYFEKNEKSKVVSLPQIWSNLNNANLYGVEIADADRIVTFKIKLKDIYQKTLEYRLIFECMPPQSNLILCLLDNGKPIIQDALLKFTYADNPQRQILPALPYESPRTSFKPEVDTENYPIVIKPADGSADVLCHNMNEYFYNYYTLVIEQKEALQRKQRLFTKWSKELKKAEKKLALQQAESEEAELEKTWLTYCEMLKTNLGLIKKGDAGFETINYYDPEMQLIQIPLKTDKSPQDNLKYYLKKYHKAKQGKEKILEQMAKTRKDIEQLKNVLLLFESDQWTRLDIDTGKTGDALVKLKQTDNLFRLPVDEHWEIIIGRKAKENDLITTQIGKPMDWWFHTRIYHGSHILLRNFHKKEPPNNLIELCCGLAAWFSKARNSENVPVDYTQIRFVRKPRKSAPGFVTYTNHKTVFVDPIDVNVAKKILAGECE
jgi:predicted ribosome quality control (RQC) complex YloA/Tae2 family protein